MDFTTRCLQLAFSNPIVLASGILDLTASSMKRVVDSGCGAVTVKSVSKEPRTGHKNPTMFGEEHYFMNAVGLSNPGAEEAIQEIRAFKQVSSAPLIGSIYAGTADEFAELATIISEAPIDALELNLSCPNVGNEFGDPFAYSPLAIETITTKVKAVIKVPLIIKLSPNAWNIGELARVAQTAGADAITAVNTVSGMQIDVRARRPILHNLVGGMSGPALFPIALKCVYDIYKSVSIPIIATGGITTGRDAIAMIMAGATLLGVGTAVYHRGETVFSDILNEMENIMKEEHIASLDSIRGVAHAL